MVRITRDAWFPLAARLLVEHGPDALRVERLCASAGVTKGSFYHHFGDLAGFRTAFLDYLVDRASGGVVQRLASVGDPVERLQALIQVIAAEDLVLEAAVRRWAAAEPQVAAAVRAADQQRHLLVRGMYRDLVPDDPHLAADLTRLAEAFYLGAVLSDPPVAGAEYRRLAGMLLAVLPEDAHPVGVTAETLGQDQDR